eukprot:TRINITY_DN980_c0_g1_i2.p1 TRINITY_DN980_c0_g1~~TRINITY_DN980_c0_g1_i2.p1  ORF type:complete len:184 (+),score=24.68 TRINITY_DN980_c0_g1_i2:41-592(+)
MLPLRSRRIFSEKGFCTWNRNMRVCRIVNNIQPLTSLTTRSSPSLRQHITEFTALTDLTLTDVERGCLIPTGSSLVSLRLPKLKGNEIGPLPNLTELRGFWPQRNPLLVPLMFPKLEFLGNLPIDPELPVATSFRGLTLRRVCKSLYKFTKLERLNVTEAYVLDLPKTLTSLEYLWLRSLWCS